MAMRSIWNRVCQAGCPCTNCSAQHGVHYSARNARSNLRSQPFALPTVSYTSTMGLATTLDGSGKNRRKAQRGAAIAEKTAETVSIEPATLLEQASLKYDTIRKDAYAILDGEHNAIRGIRSKRHGVDTIRQQVAEIQTSSIEINPESAAIETEVAIQSKENDTGQRLDQFLSYVKTGAPHVPSLQSLESHELPPQSLWTHHKLLMARSRAWCRKKTYSVELCVMRLVLELCQISQISGLSDQALRQFPISIQPFAALSRADAASLAREIELELIILQSFTSDEYPDSRKAQLGITLPSYPDQPNGDTTELNDGLVRACSQKQPLDADFVARICSHLLRSRGRPDIETVNQLLFTFIRRDRIDLVQPVLNLVYDGHFRPNELTCAATLRFYRHTAEQVKFMEYVAMMHGQKSGLMLAMPWRRTKDNLFRSNGRITANGSKLIQAVTPSSLVYLEVIMGMIRFCGLEQTWTFCTKSASRGWGFDFTCMYVLLFQSAVSSAHEIVRRVWSDARKLASYGYLIPKTLYALMIAVHKLEDDHDQSWELFKECTKQNPNEEQGILTLVQERIKLIKQTRIARADQKQLADRHMEYDYSRMKLPGELQIKKGDQWYNIPES